MVAILTGLERPSKNPKTGDMLQTWFLRSDMAPIDAMRSNADVSVCGGCPAKGDAMAGRWCYTNPLTMTSIYRTYVTGGYRRDYSPDMVRGRFLRLGAYGDPAAIPARVLGEMVNAADGHTGYSHQWRNPKLRDVMSMCMASVERSADVERANRLGFGTFRVINPTSESIGDAVMCPASSDTGVTCMDCGACNGERRNIAILAHGFGTHVARRALPVL